ncbi:unnamed protein product [Moneuplotes crassus]|uniref:Uncharacterized protein n=1 Tax=Euplotes crassus TaxID=5936 RepID=A0AAD1XF72_EUPCR|nr:unnamed protein product [Moneuplotes crassus]
MYLNCCSLIRYTLPRNNIFNQQSFQMKSKREIEILSEEWDNFSFKMNNLQSNKLGSNLKRINLNKPTLKLNPQSSESTLQDETVMFSTKMIKPKIITKIANHSFYNRKCKAKSKKKPTTPCIFDLSLNLPSKKKIPSIPCFGRMTLQKFKNKQIRMQKDSKERKDPKLFVLGSGKPQLEHKDTRKRHSHKVEPRSGKTSPKTALKLSFSIPNAPKIQKNTKEVSKITEQINTKFGKLTIPSTTQKHMNPKPYSSFISFIRNKINETTWVHNKKLAYVRRHNVNARYSPVTIFVAYL